MWASIGINDIFVGQLREVIAGRASTTDIQEAVGDSLDRYQATGELVAAWGSPEWRKAARALADAEWHALERMLERDEGMALGKEEHPPHLAPSSKALDDERATLPPVSLGELLEEHLRQLEQAGRGREARKTWSRIGEPHGHSDAIELQGRFWPLRATSGRSLRY